MQAMQLRLVLQGQRVCIIAVFYTHFEGRIIVLADIRYLRIAG